MIIRNIKKIKASTRNKHQIKIEIEKVPREIKAVAERYLSKIEELNYVFSSNEEVRQKTLCETLELLENIYSDSRFSEKTLNDKHLKLVIDDIINKIVEDEKLDIDGMLKLLVFDVNGLKTVNDNFSREVGDWYLEQIRNVVANPKNIENHLEKDDKFYFASAGGGDEFFLFLVSESLIDTDSVIINLKKKIALIDCSEKMQRPDSGFPFVATVSVGEIDFNDALKSISINDFNYLNYKEITSKAINNLFSQGHAKSLDDKKYFMNQLQRGEVTYLDIAKDDQIRLHKMLLRNEESVKQEKEIEDLKKEIGRLKIMLSQK